MAFAVLALVLATAFEIFSTGLSRAAALEERSRALAVARSRLDMVGVEDTIKPGEARGEADDPRFHWATVVDQMEEPGEPGQPLASAYAIFRVAVRVGWRGADGKDHALDLATLRLGPRP